jgi:DNA-binding winged helix-turn-helix (wHTH) protein
MESEYVIGKQYRLTETTLVLRKGGQIIGLKQGAAAVLKVLADRRFCQPNVLLTKEDIAKAAGVEVTTVPGYISHIREALSYKAIHTRTHHGYALTLPVRYEARKQRSSSVQAPQSHHAITPPSADFQSLAMATDPPPREDDQRGLERILAPDSLGVDPQQSTSVAYADILPDDRARATLLINYYRSERTSRQDHGLKLYCIEVDGERRETSVLTTPARFGMRLPLDAVSCALADSPGPYLSRSSPELRGYADFVKERLVRAGAELHDKPIYRLSNVTLEGPFRAEFSRDTFFNYRFTSGLLNDELWAALSTKKSVVDLTTALPLRDLLLPDLRALVDFKSRCTCGGAGTVFAMARAKEKDFVIPLQIRSSLVADHRKMRAVLPSGFHQPVVGHTCEVEIQWSVYHEVYEEVFQFKEDPNQRCHDYYMSGPERCAGVAYFREYPKNCHQELTGLCLNAAHGNFEFAPLLVVQDESYYDTLVPAEFLHWEYEKWLPLSTINPVDIKEKLLDPTLCSESVFQLTEGLLSLAKLDRDRVRLPDLKSFLIDI